jgi:hypothetical protein
MIDTGQEEKIPTCSMKTVRMGDLREINMILEIGTEEGVRIGITSTSMAVVVEPIEMLLFLRFQGTPSLSRVEADL